MNAWVERTLSEVITLQRGHDLPATIRGKGTVPVVGSFGVTGYHDVAKYSGPGVTIGRSGASIGVATYIETDYWPLNTALFVKDFKNNDPRWIYYLLDSIDFTAYNSGSAQPSLNRNYLAAIDIKLPPLQEQRGIADTLGALDDKIESNRRKFALIWDLAGASWASIANAETAELRDIMTLRYGKALPANTRVSGAVPVYGSSGITGWHKESLVNGPAVIIGRKGTVGSVYWSDADAFPIDTTFFVEPVRNWPMLACYFSARSAGLSAMNSDSAVPGLNRDRALATRVTLPAFEDAVAWVQKVQPSIALARAIERETDSLTALRDALLPELLAGRIRVPIKGSTP